MKSRRNFWGVGVFAGVIGFVGIVTSLHLLQPNYNPKHQHISELAIGAYGAMMLFAFCSFAISIFCAQQCLGPMGAPRVIRLKLLLAAACMFGAGIFKLNDSATLHVTLIALAFMLLVIAMYLLPQMADKFKSRQSRITSWSLAAGTAIFAALGGTMPAGLAQRATALSILLWLLWVGFRVSCPKES
jgi:hypothetical membrane protein